MKIKFTLVASFVLIVFFMVHSFTNSLNTANGGSPTSHSGGIFENGRTCATSGCHTGTAVYRDGLIAATGLPTDGYRSGKSYEIEVSVTESGRNKFGFQASSQTINGNPIGKIDENGNPDVQEQNIGSIYFAATHTFSGTSGNNNSKTWKMMWNAPAMTGEGTAYLFVAVNATNSNNAPTGDLILFDTLVIEESLINAVRFTEKKSPIHVYPIPATSTIHIKSSSLEGSIDYIIHNLSGKKVLSGQQDFSSKESINISMLPAGNYWLSLSDGEKDVIKRIIKM